MTIKREGIHSAEFILWESHPYYTRINADLDSSVERLTGTPYLQIVAGSAIQPITTANVDKLLPTLDEDDEVVAPLAKFYGFLISPIIPDTVATPLTVARALLAKGPARVNPAHIAFPAGANDGATAAMRAKIVAAAEARLIDFEA